MFTASNIHYEFAERALAIGCGGIGVIHALARDLGLIDNIDDRLQLLKIHLPYHESDHVLNLAYLPLCGGTCLEELELLRQDEAYFNAVGAQRIPDPTTAGDFCRRFDEHHIQTLQEIFDDARVRVWATNPASSSSKRSWIWMALSSPLPANARKAWTFPTTVSGVIMRSFCRWPIPVNRSTLINRSGNRPSHEQAAVHLDKAINLCRRAGFRRITLRGDTDFTQTKHLDRWDKAGDVGFVFGFDNNEALRSQSRRTPG